MAENEMLGREEWEEAYDDMALERDGALARAEYAEALLAQARAREEELREKAERFLHAFDDVGAAFSGDAKRRALQRREAAGDALRDALASSSLAPEDPRT